MTKTLLAAAAAVVMFAAPALAKDAMAKPAMEATMMCRPAMAGEKPTAMMGAKGVVCKSMKMTPHMGPDTKGMTAAQADAAWRAWLEQQMNIQSATGTAGGNG
ncbi:MAG TPA: hypothetical protein VGC72_18515 [Candidatus Elarobacter sp.]|jgi:hypothetical protein